MSIETVAGPDALSGEGMGSYYIVSAIDPHFLIAGRSGRVYVRTDGAAWQGDGWKVTETNLATGKQTIGPAHLKFDDPGGVSRRRGAIR